MTTSPAAPAFGRTSARAPVRGYRDLLVWQRAMEVVAGAYAVAAALPAAERYALEVSAETGRLLAGLTRSLRRLSPRPPSPSADTR